MEFSVKNHRVGDRKQFAYKLRLVDQTLIIFAIETFDINGNLSNRTLQIGANF